MVGQARAVGAVGVAGAGWLRSAVIAEGYIRRLMVFDDLILPAVNDACAADMSWFVFVIRLASGYTAVERDRIILGMRRHEVGAANYFPCIHQQPLYRQRFSYENGSFPIAESISSRTIALPFHNHLHETELDLVVQTLKVMLQREQLLKR